MDDRSEKILAWAVTLFSCACFAWAYVTLRAETARIVPLFASVGVELPLVTRILMSFSWFIYPLVFFGASIVNIAKEFVVTDKKISTIMTLSIVVLVLLVIIAVKDALFVPFLTFVERLAH